MQELNGERKTGRSLKDLEPGKKQDYPMFWKIKQFLRMAQMYSTRRDLRKLLVHLPLKWTSRREQIELRALEQKSQPGNSKGPEENTKPGK